MFYLPLSLSFLFSSSSTILLFSFLNSFIPSTQFYYFLSSSTTSFILCTFPSTEKFDFISTLDSTFFFNTASWIVKPHFYCFSTTTTTTRFLLLPSDHHHHHHHISIVSLLHHHHHHIFIVSLLRHHHHKHLHISIVLTLPIVFLFRSQARHRPKKPTSGKKVKLNKRSENNRNVGMLLVVVEGNNRDVVVVERNNRNVLVVVVERKQ